MLFIIIHFIQNFQRKFALINFWHKMDAILCQNISMQIDANYGKGENFKFPS